MIPNHWRFDRPSDLAQIFAELDVAGFPYFAAQRIDKMVRTIEYTTSVEHQKPIVYINELTPMKHRKILMSTSFIEIVTRVSGQRNTVTYSPYYTREGKTVWLETHSFRPRKKLNISLQFVPAHCVKLQAELIRNLEWRVSTFSGVTTNPPLPDLRPLLEALNRWKVSLRLLTAEETSSYFKSGAVLHRYFEAGDPFTGVDLWSSDIPQLIKMLDPMTLEETPLLSNIYAEVDEEPPVYRLHEFTVETTYPDNTTYLTLTIHEMKRGVVVDQSVDRTDYLQGHSISAGTLSRADRIVKSGKTFESADALREYLGLLEPQLPDEQ